MLFSLAMEKHVSANFINSIFIHFSRHSSSIRCQQNKISVYYFFQTMGIFAIAELSRHDYLLNLAYKSRSGDHKTRFLKRQKYRLLGQVFSLSPSLTLQTYFVFARFNFIPFISCIELSSRLFIYHDLNPEIGHMLLIIVIIRRKSEQKTTKRFLDSMLWNLISKRFLLRPTFYSLFSNVYLALHILT